MAFGWPQLFQVLACYPLHNHHPVIAIAFSCILVPLFLYFSDTVGDIHLKK